MHHLGVCQTLLTVVRLNVAQGYVAMVSATVFTKLHWDIPCHGRSFNGWEDEWSNVWWTGVAHFVYSIHTEHSVIWGWLDPGAFSKTCEVSHIFLPALASNCALFYIHSSLHLVTFSPVFYSPPAPWSTLPNHAPTPVNNLHFLFLHFDLCFSFSFLTSQDESKCSVTCQSRKRHVNSYQKNYLLTKIILFSSKRHSNN